MCKDLNIRVVDLIPVFKELDMDKLRCSPDDTCHINSKGGEIIARILLEYLEKNRYIFQAHQ
ncbi:hypothetical protein ACFLTD_02305 [Elusimicrobiota bacterium]